MESQGKDQGYKNNRKYKAGYEYLLAWKITMPIYDYTVVFCRRCQGSPGSTGSKVSYPPLSSHRTFDQMVQAARSGFTNIPEGNQQKSLAGYIKLTGVNKGSLEELLKDYLSYARQNQIPVWEKVRVEKEVRELGEVWEILKRTPTLPDSPNFPNLPNNPAQAINLLITLINQAIYLQKRLEQSLEEKHTKEGGFNENLLKKRLEYRSKF